MGVRLAPYFGSKLAITVAALFRLPTKSTVTSATDADVTVDFVGSLNNAATVIASLLRNPVQRGHRFQRKADSNPVIADSG